MRPTSEIRYGDRLVALATCAGCETIGDVIPVGHDTYTVSAPMGGHLPDWSEVKALGLKRANELCDAQKKQMTVVSWQTHGARGWTSLGAELTFTSS